MKIIEKMKDERLGSAVLYNFTKLDDTEKYLIGLTMEEKKWIVFPWETKFEI